MSLNKPHTVVIAVVFLCIGLTWAGRRPTKRIKFFEGDGAPEGKLMFTIDSLSENEQFRISGYNPWVTVEPTGNVLVKRKWDYEKLDQEKIIDFWVTIADTKGKDSDNQRVIVQVKDVNDEPPYFINRPLPMQAVVQLNAPPNTPVFTLQARDPDTDHHIRYFLVRNTTGGRFEVDERSGVVHTRGNEPFKLDMEYVLYVKAEDHKGRFGDGRFQSTPEERLSIIGGKRRPQFYKPSYKTKIPKNQKKDTEIISVKARSFAEREIRYTLKATGQGAGTFNIGPTTGNVRLAKDLDFEDLQQPHVYQLQLTASEDSNDVSTSVELTIHVTDLNKPIFSECSSYSPKIEEGAPNGSPVVRVQATDADKGVNGQVKYSIVQQPNQKGTKFTVDEETGEIFTNKVFDREGDDGKFVSVTVKATDQGDPSLEGVCSFTVEITDVNDNAPRFLKDYRPVLREHTPPRKIIEILATDDDDISKGNGPPFHFRMDPNVDDLIRASFKVENYPKGANGDGMAIVTSLRMFDREHQKEFQVPIVIKDSGKPAKSSTSTLTVIIGDINDYKMRPGSKRIVVYNYMGHSPDTEIGRVDVYDMDDWDLSDKKFYWDTKEHQNFTLHQDTGMLTMRHGTRDGSYNLRFRVSDYYLNQNNIPAVVTIVVKEISYEAVTSSGSIRISGITDEDFIRIWDYGNQDVVKSKIDKLRDKLAQLLAIDRENVDIFSVQLRQERPPITDIRFSVNIPPYYKPIILNGIVLQHREEIETEVGINITMVGINECLVENQACEGSCTNTMEVGPLPYLINSNKTALVGVQVDIKPECTCGALNLVREMSCRNNPCQNGGSCIEDHSEITCQCQSGYEGPHCEQTYRSFFGNEWAWFPALEMCESSHLSIEFLAKNLDGTLLYNGPMIPPKPYETISSDFIAIELVSGNPRLLIDFGAGTLELVLESNDTYQLDDDNWHRIDVFWDTKNIRMVLDLCNFTSKAEDRTVYFFNRTVCEVKDVIPPFNKYLDVSSPLQIGGMSHPSLDPSQFLWDYYPHGERFNGSIRNVIHNSKIYDLAECEVTRSIWKMGSTDTGNFPCKVKFSW